MGRLECIASDAVHVLRPQEVIGRSRACSLRVDHPSVSGVHATIAWTGGAWTVRDATSTNGTFVDGDRVAPGQAIQVHRGSRIRFGSASVWRVAAADPPAAHVVHLDTGETRSIEGGVIVLGDDETSPCVVYDEATDTYWVETPDSRDRIPNEGVVHGGGRSWVLQVPETLLPTQSGLTAPHVSQLTAEFVVSPDEEHVAMTIRTAARRWDLPGKAHHYTLLVLARHRIADQSAGIGPSEAGWIEREALLKELRIGANLLYTHVFRARKELSALGIESGAAVVERRTGQIRIGIPNLEVHPTP